MQFFPNQFLFLDCCYNWSRGARNRFNKNYNHLWKVFFYIYKKIDKCAIIWLVEENNTEDEERELLLHERQQVQTSDCHSAYYCGRQRADARSFLLLLFVETIRRGFPSSGASLTECCSTEANDLHLYKMCCRHGGGIPVIFFFVILISLIKIQIF